MVGTEGGSQHAGEDLFAKKSIPCTPPQKLLIIGALAVVGLFPQKHQMVFLGQIRRVLRQFPEAHRHY
jgi:hypothetical protein